MTNCPKTPIFFLLFYSGFDIPTDCEDKVGEKAKFVRIVDTILLQGTDSTWAGKKKIVYLCVHTVWTNVQSRSKEGCDVGPIYLFIKLSLSGLKWHLCP